MTVTFENSDQDAIALNLFYNFHTPKPRRKHRIIHMVSPIVVFAALLTFFATTRPDDLGLPYFWLILVGGAAADFALHPWLMRRAVRRRTQQAVKQGKYLTLMGSQTLTATPEALVAKGPIAESRYNWSSIAAVSEGPEHLFLFLSESVALPIPKRAFTSEAQRTEFLALVDRYRTGGVAVPAPVAVDDGRASWWHSRYGVESERSDISVNRRG
jgi:hypothetical protein